MTTVKTYGWLSPEKLKFINDNPHVVSLLYDLGLLPEEVSARVRGYVEEERQLVLDWAKAKVLGHRELAIKAQDAGDEEKASTHIAIETAYFGVMNEIKDCEHHKFQERKETV